MTERPQRISYFPLDQMDDRMLVEMERCATVGTPRPESSAIRAHSQAAFWFFADSWKSLFHEGVVEHSLKELCRLYVSRSVKCEYCGNQRSVKAQGDGLTEGKLDELMNFETSGTFDVRQRAALSYAEAITWRLDPDDAFWDRLHANFSEEELVELACFITLTMGQQSWLRLLNIDHHQLMAGTDASMAPGFEDADALRASKDDARYWATQPS
ncbi:MAG: carboxymuconolactone decarboxylase family protein [Acidobacteriota bacterium]|nr:carboxymuconolactone decarboxylase family protein [Acidobacteriota bacterium]MDE3107876.1 carboxymuconolactone decarboxylase family protein [Acidobacteriota bacterium]